VASDVGLDVFRTVRHGKGQGRPGAAGYNEGGAARPHNSVAEKPLGDIAADMLQQAGMNVEYAGLISAWCWRQLKGSLPKAAGRRRWQLERSSIG
jgi:peptide/nickel transport system substrate-binding protein